MVFVLDVELLIGVVLWAMVFGFVDIVVFSDEIEEKEWKQ